MAAPLNGKPANGKPVDERERRMRSRNRALLAVLLGLVALFYAIAIVRISGG
ncbi:MAG TPA: hypothetical protein VHW90_04395 [Stellaceae bacterium]|jgi:hypothetical protein|nr:hypothetical protein [Stellaceae bacterium]